MHWGFMGWKPKAGSRSLLPINTRSEEILEKSMWRSVSMQRCLIPMNGFYEWSGAKGNKTPTIYKHPITLFFLQLVFILP